MPVCQFVRTRACVYVGERVGGEGVGDARTLVNARIRRHTHTHTRTHTHIPSESKPALMCSWSTRHDLESVKFMLIFTEMSDLLSVVNLVNAA